MDAQVSLGAAMAAMVADETTIEGISHRADRFSSSKGGSSYRSTRAVVEVEAAVTEAPQ